MTEQSLQQDRIQKRQYWEAKISRWKESGMSQAEYCRGHDLKIKTFSYWLRKFRKEKTATVQFVELPSEKLFAYKNEPNRITELKLIIDEGISIEVGDGFNPGTLKQVIETIRQL